MGSSSRGRKQREAGAGSIVHLDHFPEGPGRNQRHVARQDQKVAGLAGPPVSGNLHGMSGSQLGNLLGEFNGPVPQLRLHQGGLMPHDHQSVPGVQGLDGLQKVFHQRPSRQWLQHFRQGRLEARALSGRHDQDAGWIHV